MKLDQALQKFLLQLDADGRSIHTRKQYERHVRLLGRWLEREGLSPDVRRIGHETLARFLCSPQARHRPDGKAKRATSTNALRGSIRNVFRYLHEAGHLRQDPSRLIRRAVCSPPPPRALSEGEQRRLLKGLAEAKGEKARRDYALFDLMLSSGVRVGSVVALDVEDVDLDAGQLWLRSTKGDRPDRVFLGRKILGHLRRWIGDRTTGPLFPGHGGRPLTTRHIGRRLGIWVRIAGIRRAAGPHTLRHSFATSLLRRTSDIFLVQQALRHRSIASTVVYSEFDDQRLRRTI